MFRNLPNPVDAGGDEICFALQMFILVACGLQIRTSGCTSFTSTQTFCDGLGNDALLIGFQLLNHLLLQRNKRIYLPTLFVKVISYAMLIRKRRQRYYCTLKSSHTDVNLSIISS